MPTSHDSLRAAHGVTAPLTIRWQLHYEQCGPSCRAGALVHALVDDGDEQRVAVAEEAGGGAPCAARAAPSFPRAPLRTPALVSPYGVYSL